MKTPKLCRGHCNIDAIEVENLAQKKRGNSRTYFAPVADATQFKPPSDNYWVSYL